jgi:hypothetical protein
MERFGLRHGRRRAIRLLLTFVRIDFVGSMTNALRTEGYCAGKRTPVRQAIGPKNRAESSEETVSLRSARKADHL